MVVLALSVRSGWGVGGGQGTDRPAVPLSWPRGTEEYAKINETFIGFPTRKKSRATFRVPNCKIPISNLKMWGLKNHLRYHHQLVMPVYQIVISLTYTKWSIPTTIGMLSLTNQIFNNKICIHALSLKESISYLLPPWCLFRHRSKYERWCISIQSDFFQLANSDRQCSNVVCTYGGHFCFGPVMQMAF